MALCVRLVFIKPPQPLYWRILVCKGVQLWAVTRRKRQQRLPLLGSSACRGALAWHVLGWRGTWLNFLFYQSLLTLARSFMKQLTLSTAVRILTEVVWPGTQETTAQKRHELAVLRSSCFFNLTGKHALWRRLSEGASPKDALSNDALPTGAFRRASAYTFDSPDQPAPPLTCRAAKEIRMR